ncbi:MAG: aminoglycoside phosphotransferase family protein [Anaerolineae bacterium]|nr:aminoglycoside phosphotransferase family protein [Anaerolineae bacterium]
MNNSFETLHTIAEKFASGNSVSAVTEFGNGNINDTYIVTCSPQEKFVLQRINTHVFKQPSLIMQNMRAFTEHVHRRVRLEGRVWDSPRVIPAQDGNDYFIDSENGFWRAISFIDNARSFDTITDSTHAREVGYALGTFQSLISDLPIDSLADTLEGFHITPRYLQHYDTVFPQHKRQLSPEVKHGIQFIEERRAFAFTLEDAGLPLRPIHGDPKVNNVMVHNDTGKAISIVDLDTVKPGLVHYDIGDCIRSGSNPLGEDAENWQAVHYNPEIGAALLEGYLAEAQAFLTPADYEHLYTSIRLLAFELGLRFFSDYLAGDVYFKVKYPEHNLQRALVQFQLTQSIEAHEAEIRNSIQKVVKA